MLELELTAEVGRSLLDCSMKVESRKLLLSLLPDGLVVCLGLLMMLEDLVVVDVLILSDVCGNMIGTNLRMNLRCSRSHTPSKTRSSPTRLRIVSSRSIMSKVSLKIVPILASMCKLYIYIYMSVVNKLVQVNL